MICRPVNIMKSNKVNKIMENSKAKFGVLYIVIMLSDINDQVRI